MRNIFKKRSKEDAVIVELEKKLQTAMQPVSPRREFVVDLHRQLMSRKPEISLAQQYQQNVNRWLLVSGIVGSILMLITSIRGIVAIFGVINLLTQRFNRNPLPPETVPAAS